MTRQRNVTPCQIDGNPSDWFRSQRTAGQLMVARPVDFSPTSAPFFHAIAPSSLNRSFSVRVFLPTNSQHMANGDHHGHFAVIA